MTSLPIPSSMSAASRYLDERNEERLQAIGLVEL